MSIADRIRAHWLLAVGTFLAVLANFTIGVGLLPDDGFRPFNFMTGLAIAPVVWWNIHQTRRLRARRENGES